MCGEKLKLPKTEELAIIFIQCSCGCGSFIQVRNGYHIPSVNVNIFLYKNWKIIMYNN